MGFLDVLRREFSLSNMLDRAIRKAALDAAQTDLLMWADYGDPAYLDRAIARLRGTEPSRAGRQS